MINMPAVIFAGGKSSRMGQDKALLPFSNYTSLSEYQYKKLSKLFKKVYLSSKAKKFNFTCNIILDTHLTSSPLVALVSVLETLKSPSIFILSVDAPLVDKKIIETLFDAYTEAPDKYDAVIAESPKGIEPLCGIYSSSILNQAKEALQNDRHKLMSLLKNCKKKTVLFKDDDAFININHPHEYQSLLLR